MTTEGPGPSGPGPSASAIEQARHRMYGPGASPGDIAAYERLVDAAKRMAEAAQPDRDAAIAAVQLPGPAMVSEPRRRSRLVVLVPLVVIVLGLIVVVLLPRGPVPLPDWVSPPSARGTTITTLARESDPRAAPDLITYQPQGYTVFQPAGRAVRVRIRCQGAGTVTVTAGQRFAFRCGVGQTVQEAVGPPTEKPFVVIGTTHGNVVWAARITLN